MKNLQPISSDNWYEGLGFLDQFSSGTVVYPCRIGLTHTTGGNPFVRKMTEDLTAWEAPVLVNSGIKDCRDVYGIIMKDEGYPEELMMFIQRFSNPIGTDELQIIKCDEDLNFGTPVDFDWSVVGERLQRGWFFGKVVKGDNPLEYYATLVQTTQTPVKRRISIIKTTDRWETYSEVGVVYSGTLKFSESCLANLGSGKFLSLIRKDDSGVLYGYESTNYCASWTARPASNLYWFITNPEVPHIHVHDGVFDIFYECRDAFCMEISKGNTLSNFGLKTPHYNEPEIYVRHKGTGSNPSLGYGQERKLIDGRFLMLYCKELTNTKANPQWTMDDLVTDSVVPDAPVITVSSITATSFRIDITNYPDNNPPRYLIQDIAYDPDFTNFVTCKYRIPTSTAYPAVVMQNIRMNGFWDVYNALTSGTTYYLRIKAVNNVGESSYKIKTVTCL